MPRDPLMDLAPAVVAVLETLVEELTAARQTIQDLDGDQRDQLADLAAVWNAIAHTKTVEGAENLRRWIPAVLERAQREHDRAQQ